MKALVGAFNQEKALVGAFSVIVKPVVEPMDRFTALIKRQKRTIFGSVLGTCGSRDPASVSNARMARWLSLVSLIYGPLRDFVTFPTVKVKDDTR